MDLFRITVIVVAVVIFIIIMTLIGILIQTANAQGGTYPPILNPCPDGWMVDGSSNCIIPSNINLGNVSDFSTTAGYFVNPYSGNQEINFADAGWTVNGITTQCNKKLWANTNGIVWDTISNYNQC